MKNHNINVAFIFGAGASVDDGAPVMDDFLDKSREILRNSELYKYKIDKFAFDDVFNSFADIRGIHSKSYLNLDNIEILFGAIEMGILIEKYGNRKLYDIERLKRSLITLIVQTIESSLKLKKERELILPPTYYNKFISKIKFHKDAKKNYYGFSFITFNYDVGLDLSLLAHQIPFEYFNKNESVDVDIVPLLKLHGSINWYKENEDAEITFLNANNSLYENYIEPKTVFNCIGTEILGMGRYPFIIPPSWNKYEYQNQLKTIWKKAAKVLSEAEIIFIIGYSFPETDLFFKYLYSLGSDSNTNILKIYVINPDVNLKSKFKDILSPSLLSNNKLIFKDLTFANSIDYINKELGSLIKY